MDGNPDLNQIGLIYKPAPKSRSESNDSRFAIQWECFRIILRRNGLLIRSLEKLLYNYVFFKIITSHFKICKMNGSFELVFAREYLN